MWPSPPGPVREASHGTAAQGNPRTTLLGLLRRRPSERPVSRARAGGHARTVGRLGAKRQSHGSAAREDLNPCPLGRSPALGLLSLGGPWALPHHL